MVYKCHKYGKQGYKWGINGTCHLMNDNTEASKERAIKRAEKDGEYLKRNQKDQLKGMISWYYKLYA